MKYLSILILLAASLANAQEPNPDKTKGRIYEVLADYQINFDDLQQKRFAYVGRAKQVTIKNGKTREQDRWYVGVQESDKRRLDGSSHAGPNAERYVERWVQRLKYDGKISMRGEIYGVRSTYEVKDVEKDEKYKKWRGQLVVLRPLAQVFGAVDTLSSHGSRASTQTHLDFLDDSCELVSADYTEDGDINASFKFDRKYSPGVEIAFAKKAGYFPSDIRSTMALGGKRFLLGHTLVRWEKRGDVHVPIEMAANGFSPNGREEHFKLKIDWRIDAKLPKDILKPASQDWREPIRVLFDVDWQRLDVRPPETIPPLEVVQ